MTVTKNEFHHISNFKMPNLMTSEACLSVIATAVNPTGKPLNSSPDIHYLLQGRSSTVICHPEVHFLWYLVLNKSLEWPQS